MKNSYSKNFREFPKNYKIILSSMAAVVAADQTHLKLPRT